MTDQTAGNPRSGAPSWMKMALVASLVVNIAVIGLFIGAGMTGKSDRAGGAQGQIKWILKLVPDERHDFTKTKFEDRRDDLRKAQADRNRHMKAILAAIRAQPFAPEALDYAMRMRREAGEERRKIVHTSLIEVLVEFEQPEREQFADRLKSG